MYANATLPEEFSASCCRQTASSKLKRRLELQLKWKYCAIHPNNSVSCVSLTTCSILRGTLVQKVSEKVERFRHRYPKLYGRLDRVTFDRYATAKL